MINPERVALELAIIELNEKNFLLKVYKKFESFTNF